MFADDILIYKTITTPNDHNILQTDLDSLSQWASDWLMEFNIPKCKILQFISRVIKSSFTYKMSNTPLDIVTQHNYLGVCLHHRLSWKPHADYIYGKANQLLGFLKRNLCNTPIHIKEYLHKQLLVPSIEYCSAIWDMHHDTTMSCQICFK